MMLQAILEPVVLGRESHQHTGRPWRVITISSCAANRR
jgi:hypothetical protein